MSLSVYTEVYEETALSKNGDFTNPLAITFDGRLGGVQQRKLFIRNNNFRYYYTSIVLQLIDDSGDPIINRPEDGFVWKLYAGDAQPSQNDWANIAPATAVAFSDIGSSTASDTSSYLPFWVYIEIPEGLSIQVFKTVKFRITGEENVI